MLMSRVFVCFVTDLDKLKEPEKLIFIHSKR